MVNSDEKNTPWFLLPSSRNNPLKLWEKKIRGGHIYQVLDRDLMSSVFEISSKKSSRTYITCPADQKSVLGIPAPFLNLTIKNLQKSLAIDILIKDDKDITRRFRILTKQKQSQVKPFLCKVPLTLEEGWNDIVVPLKDFTYEAFGSVYVETLRIQMHATCRVQKVFFSF